MRYSETSLCALTAFFLLGCSSSGSDLLIHDNACISGLAWPHGDEGSELMHPGRDCIHCHATQDEGPRYEVAGTVYATLTEEDDCGGLEGATIEITDFNNKVFTMTTNAAGNFSMTPEQAEGIEYPATVKAIYDGRENPMLGLLPYGNCADCHTRKGNWTAAGGRVFVPLGN